MIESRRSSQAVSILLDTDIGSDIDDAIALAYLLRHPDCTLLGISTVTGDVQKRAACASAICRDAGRTDIPICCGLSETLGPGPGQPDVPHYPAIAGHGPTTFPSGAVDFLRQTVRANPGRITLLSIGPFTNIAALFSVDPEIPALLAGYVSMGGRFDRSDQVEWNARVDPLATAIVYHQSPFGHTSIGLDVTAGCRIGAPDARAAFDSMPSLLAMTNAWLAVREDIALHDPLAAASVLHPELCSYDTGDVAVPPTAADGTTVFTAGGSRQKRIATSVRAEPASREILAGIAGGCAWREAAP